MLNVIVLVSDSLRWDALGVNGGPGWLDINTPELDDFAGEAVCFDGARVSSFPTIPMRTDCFTGRFSHPRYGWQELEKGLETLPVLFRRAGYTTQLLADTTHLLRSCFWRPFQHFDFLRGHEGDAPLAMTNDPPARLWRDMRKTRVERDKTFDQPATSEVHAQHNAWWRYESDRLNTRLADKTCHWLEDNWRGGPFLLWVDFFDVHEPWDPPEYLWRMYQPDYDGEPMTQPNYHGSEAYSPDELANLRARYAGEVTMVSKNMGRVVRMVDEMGLGDNTIVVTLSDHGIYIGERGRTGKSLIMPGKFDAFPQHVEISRLVWMMRVPSAKPARIPAIVQPPDLLPTLLDLCGMEQPSDVEGQSLAPQIEDGVEAGPRTAIATWTMATHHSPDILYCRMPTVTDGEWTLVIKEPPDPRPPELYHVAKDPREQENVIGEEQAEAKRLHAQMLDWLRGKGTPAEAISRLEAVDWPS
jgi:arylsulfatase A-like enzyme